MGNAMLYISEVAGSAVVFSINSQARVYDDEIQPQDLWAQSKH